MAIVDGVCRRPYKLMNISLKNRQTLCFSKAGSNLFHSIIVNGKKEFFKTLPFVLRMFTAFLVE